LTHPSTRVDADAFGALWLAVAHELDDEFFGLDSRRMKVGSFALLCRALLSHRTVGGALGEAQRGFALFLDDVRVDLRSEGGLARLELHNHIAAPAARRFADEALLVMLHGLLCWLAGRRVTIRAVHLAWPRPPHAAEYRRMFSPTLRFDAALTPRFGTLLHATAQRRRCASSCVMRRNRCSSSGQRLQLGGSACAQAPRRDWPTVDAVAVVGVGRDAASQAGH
jgi:hypothetical protein